jgi:phage replication O-like protein O
MGPQCEDGYTKIANELLEALCRIRIPGESMQIFLVIIRKTYGYGKKMDRISLSQFVAATGMKKPNVCRSLKQLETLGVIQIDKVVIQNDNTSFVTYRINKLYETWEIEKRKQVRKQPLSKTITDVIQNDTHNIKKETTTKENEIGEKRFQAPSPHQVQAYMDELGFDGDAERFVDHYAARGWMIGKNKMKDWKAAVRTWRKNDFNAGKSSKLTCDGFDWGGVKI